MAFANAEGKSEPYLFFVTSITPISTAESRVDGLSAIYPYNVRVFRLAPNGYNKTYEEATPEERLKYGFFCTRPDGLMSDGTPGYPLSSRLG